MLVVFASPVSQLHHFRITHGEILVMFAGFPETTDACVDAYSVNPCACRAFAPELCEGLPQVYQRFLIEVLEVLGVTGIHVAYLSENPPILFYQ